MENRYMLLSNVPHTKQTSTIKKKFGKLTLATIKKEGDAPGQCVVTSQRKLYFDADESLLTDDDDEDCDPEAEEEKENQIFNTQSPEQQRDLVKVTLKSQRISERRESTESVEFQMAKLEISQSQHLTDDQKRSQVLFGSESTHQGTLMESRISNIIKEETTGGPIRQSIDWKLNNSVASIVTISSTDTSTVIEPQEEQVVISDEESINGDLIDDNPKISEETRLSNNGNDEDLSHFSGSLPSKCSEPNCSAPDANINPESLITSSVMRKLSDFFNKIPDLEEHNSSAIDLTISETPPQQLSPVKSGNVTAVSLPETLDNDIHEDEGDVIENSQEDIIPSMAPTPAKLFTPVSVVSQPSSVRRKQKGSQEINVRTQVTNEKEEVINISAKIKVNIVIRTQDVSTTEDEQSLEESSLSEVKPTVFKEEDESPGGGDQNNPKGKDTRSPSNDRRVSSENHDDKRRTSREIAEMDTQSNSPTNLNNVVGDTSCRRFQEKNLNRESFVPFKNTPKGRTESQVDRIIAEMDTEVDSSSVNSFRKTPKQIPQGAELDTVLNLTEDDRPNLSRNTAEMDTELNTEPDALHQQVNDDDSIELDEASIAILNSLYGSEWKTPQLLKSVKRTTTSAETSFQPNMTDFQKFNANIQRDLESTRMDHRGSLKKPPIGAIQKTKSMEDAPKTPLTIFKTKSLIQSPYFSNKKPSTAPTTTSNKKPLRTPLKATPKYRKILQVVDTDSSDEETIDIDSDESYKAGSASNSSESDSESSNNSSSSGSDKKRRGRKGATKRNSKKSTSRKGFDFTQIASSDSELDDTIFIDKDKVPAPILVVRVKEEEVSKSITEGGKRKLFSDLANDTPTSSSDEKDPLTPRGLSSKEEEDRRLKDKEIRFPWLHQLTPAHKTVTGIKQTEFLTPRPVGKCGFLSSLDMKIGKAIADPEAIIYREMYKQKKEELAEKLFKIYNESVFGGALDQVPIKWNKKLLTTAGRCINMGRLGKRSAEVELSEKVLTSADRLRCTLIHELCHAAAWIVDAEKKGHAGYWKRWTERAVKALPELPKISVRHDYNIEYKYTYQCTKCAAKTQMHSKTKKAENIRCRFCHGDIEILLNKKTKTGDVVKTPVRAASGFALFVKENYKKLKQPSLKHADVMKLLSQNFAELKVQKNDEDVLL